MQQVLRNQFKQLVIQCIFHANENVPLCYVLKTKPRKGLYGFVSFRKAFLLLNLVIFSFIQVKGQHVSIYDSVAKLPKGSYLLPDLKSINPETIRYKKVPNRRIDIDYSGNEFHYFLVNYFRKIKELTLICLNLLPLFQMAKILLK